MLSQPDKLIRLIPSHVDDARVCLLFGDNSSLVLYPGSEALEATTDGPSKLMVVSNDRMEAARARVGRFNNYMENGGL